jgi:hypothetical protein
MASYEYEALDPSKREIRLVEIQPTADWTSSAPVECLIFKGPLDDAPPFFALSYCWGDPANRVPILLNGFEFPVTVNLGQALRRLRRVDERKVYWIDAICIDQLNNPEKSHQVTLMKDLYERAESVDIWLGEEGENSALAVDLIGMLADKELIDKLDVAGESDENLSMVRRYYEDHPELLDAAAWEALQRLFERPWWTRVWVFQELLMSKVAMFRCGDKWFHWIGLYYASMAHGGMLDNPTRNLLRQEQWDSVHDTNFAIPMTLVEYKLCRHFEGFQFIEHQEDLPIRLMTRLKSTNPRDMLYALLSIAGLKDVPLVPDYDKSVSEVYRTNWNIRQCFIARYT